MKLASTITLIAVSWLVPSFAHAQTMPVSAELQAALFKKIFDYDRTLESKGAVRIAVVYGDREALARELVESFENASLQASTVPFEELAARIGEVSVVYVTPGVDRSLVGRLCTEHEVLSVSGFPDFAASGEVSVGIGIREQKPEILVHLRRVKAEKHELASALLQLARVIR